MKEKTKHHKHNICAGFHPGIDKTEMRWRAWEGERMIKISSDHLITVILISWVMVHLLRLMNSSYLVLLSVRIFLLTLMLMLFLTRFQNCLVLSRGAQEACPLMLCLTSIRPLSCHILERFSRAGPRGRGREWATLGVHPLSWLLSNNRLEKVPFVSVLHTPSNRLLLSNQDKGCTPCVAHSLPLPLGPALLNLWTIYCACVWAPYQRNHLDRLEKVQRKITRTLFFKQFPNADVRPPYSNRLTDLDIVRVEDALKIQRLILCFKILNDLAPASFGSYIQHSRLVNTRLLHQASRTSSFFNSMFISLPRLWEMKYHLICMLSIICLVLK